VHIGVRSQYFGPGQYSPRSWSWVWFVCKELTDDAQEKELMNIMAAVNVNKILEVSVDVISCELIEKRPDLGHGGDPERLPVRPRLLFCCINSLRTASRS
jgi:hypothetical protein